MLDDHDFGTRAAHRARRLQTEQASAQHHGAPRARAPRDQALRIAEVTEGEHAGQRDAG